MVVSPRSRIDTGMGARGASHHDVDVATGSAVSSASTPKWFAAYSPNAAAANEGTTSGSAVCRMFASRRKSARRDEAPMPTRDKRVRLSVSVLIAEIASRPSLSMRDGAPDRLRNQVAR